MSDRPADISAFEAKLFQVRSNAPLARGLDDEDRHLCHNRIWHRDGIFAFTLFAPVLFVLELGTYGAVLFSLVAVLYGAISFRKLECLLRRSWYLLLFPAVALLSTIWSVSPADTIKHAAEYALTMIAALELASTSNPRSTLWGIFAALALYTFVSIAVGNQVDVGTSGVKALAGLSNSKNEEGDIAAAGAIVSAALLLFAARFRQPVQGGIALAAGCTEAYVAVASQSSGAWSSVAIALLVLLVFFSLRNAGGIVRAFSVCATGFVTVAGMFAFIGFTQPILDWLAENFHKDATLTGRTYLWARAHELSLEHPLLGVGFGAFWRQGNLDAEGLWQFAGIDTREGFNFHSVFYDVLVSLGWMGVALFAATLILGLIRLSVLYTQRPALMNCFWLSMAAYLIVRMPTETLGTYEFYFSTLLLFALLGWPGRSTERA